MQKILLFTFATEFYLDVYFTVWTLKFSAHAFNKKYNTNQKKKLMYLIFRISFQELITPKANKSITDYCLKIETLGFQTTYMNNFVKWLITILIIKVIVNKAENFTLKIILNRFYWVWRFNRFKILRIAAAENLPATRNKILSNKIWNCFFPNYIQSRIMLQIVRQNILPLDLLLWTLTLLISVLYFINLINKNKMSVSKFSKIKRKQKQE